MTSSKSSVVIREHTFVDDAVIQEVATRRKDGGANAFSGSRVLGPAWKKKNAHSRNGWEWLGSKRLDAAVLVIGQK